VQLLRASGLMPTDHGPMGSLAAPGPSAAHAMRLGWAVTALPALLAPAPRLACLAGGLGGTRGRRGQGLHRLIELLPRRQPVAAVAAAAQLRPASFLPPPLPWLSCSCSMDYIASMPTALRAKPCVPAPCACSPRRFVRPWRR
jgi:hypothetical protein